MKKHWRWALTAVFALFLLIAFLRLDAADLLYSMAQIPWWVAVAMIALQIATQILINLQWVKVAKIAEMPLSFKDMLYINAQGSVIDSITPGVKFGGEVARAVYIKKMGNYSTEQASVIIALQKMFSLSALCVVLLLVAGYAQLPIYSILFVILLIAVLAIFLYKKRKHIAGLHKKPIVCGGVFLLSLAIWVLYPLKMYILVVIFAPDASIAHVAAITFAAYMVAMLPIFIGGLGGFEATMTGLLAAMGIGVSPAAVITIFFRFITFWLVMLFGLMYIGLCKIIEKIREGARGSG